MVRARADLLASLVPQASFLEDEVDGEQDTEFDEEEAGESEEAEEEVA